MKRWKDAALGSFPARVVKRYAAASGGTWATNIAWNALFAFFPILLVILTGVGLVMRGQSVGPTLEHDISSALPGQQGQLVVEALRSFRSAAGPLAVVSFVGLLWSGAALFGAIDKGLDALYPCPSRSFVSQKLMAVRMIFVFTLLIIPAVASSSLLTVVDRVPGIPGFLSSGPVALLLQVGLGIVDGALLFAAIYLWVPNQRHRLGVVLPGALTAGILFEAFNLLFPVYFRLEHGFSTYGATFALFFLLLTYAYYLAQIIMLGGAVNAERDPPRPGAWPRAASIAPDAQAERDEVALSDAREAPALR